jgi:outer membrane lipoprotein SlyB
MSPILPSGGNGIDINNVMQTIQATQPQSTKGGAFRKIAGALVGGVGNIFMPGVGSAIGNMISGGMGSAGSMLGPGAQQALMFQQQMSQDMQQFEMTTTLIKNRHDSVMSAIRNMKSS